MTETTQARHATSRDGTEIAYWTNGTGPALVLVHGSTADHTRWRNAVALLEPYATVHTLDRRGRGGSGDREPYAVEREGEDIAAVVDAVATATGGPVVLLGHSYGGVCCLEATLRTSSLGGLVLYEPPVGPLAHDQVGNIDQLEAMLEDGRRDEMLQVFFAEEVGMPEKELAFIRSLPAWQGRVAAAHTLVRELRTVQTYDLEPSRFASFAFPTLLLLGGDSPAYFAAGAELLTSAIAGARVEVMDGQQHVAMDTAPEVFTQLVIDFLGSRL